MPVPRFIILTAAILILGAELQACEHTESSAADLEAKIDSLFADWDSADSPGGAISVLKDGNIVLAKGYGIANLEHEVPITPDTVFDVASVSKQFTAYTIVSLVGQGRLSLEDDIRDYLPGLSDSIQSVTVRHLLNHTSGFRDVYNLSMFTMAPGEIGSQEGCLDLVRHQRELNFAPGSEYEYSNTNYLILATITERITGQSFRDWLTKHLFERLQMTRSDIRDDHLRIVPGRASSYSHDKQGFRNNLPTGPGYGAGGVYSTVSDLSRWLLYLHESSEAAAPEVEQMFQRGVLSDGKTIDYASGLIVDQHRGLRRIGHAGSYAGYASYAGYFPDQRFGIVVLSNAPSSPWVKAMEVADLYLSRAMEAPQGKPKMARIELDTTEAIVGRYLLTDGRVIAVTREEDKIFAQVTNWRRRRIFPSSDTDFFYQEFDTRLRFVKNAVGQVTHVIMRRNGTDHRAERLSPGSGTSELKDLAAYAGNYVSPELDTSFAIAVEDDSLVATHRHLDRVVFERVQGDIFASRQLGLARFERDTEGRVSSFRLTNMSFKVRNLLFARQD